MRLSQAQLVELMKDIDPARVSSRKQAGRNLSYVEAHDIKAQLIRIFGFGGFSADVIDSQVLKVEADVPRKEGGTTAWRVTAMSTVRLTIPWQDPVFPDSVTTYTETAAASQAGADIGEVTDFAIKTASSDALKRCAIYLGTQFGLSLYNNGSKQDTIKRVVEPDQAAPLEEYYKEVTLARFEKAKESMLEAETRDEVKRIWVAATFGAAPEEMQAEVTKHALSLPVEGGE